MMEMLMIPRMTRSRTVWWHDAKNGGGDPRGEGAGQICVPFREHHRLLLATLLLIGQRQLGALTVAQHFHHAPRCMVGRAAA